MHIVCPIICLTFQIPTDAEHQICLFTCNFDTLQMAAQNEITLRLHALHLVPCSCSQSRRKVCIHQQLILMSLMAANAYGMYPPPFGQDRMLQHMNINRLMDSRNSQPPSKNRRIGHATQKEGLDFRSGMEAFSSIGPETCYA